MDSSEKYYYLSNNTGEPVGPLTWEVMLQLRNAGVFDDEARCARAGADTWLPFSKLVDQKDAERDKLYEQEEKLPPVPELSASSSSSDIGKNDVSLSGKENEKAGNFLKAWLSERSGLELVGIYVFGGMLAIMLIVGGLVAISGLLSKNGSSTNTNPYNNSVQNETALQRELQNIEWEIHSLTLYANRLRSEMNQAEWFAFVGGLQAGYGTLDGDGWLAVDGLNNVAQASHHYDWASYSHQQVQNRYNQLVARRAEILSQLR